LITIFSGHVLAASVLASFSLRPHITTIWCPGDNRRTESNRKRNKLLL